MSTRNLFIHTQVPNENHFQVALHLPLHIGFHEDDVSDAMLMGLSSRTIFGEQVFSPISGFVARDLYMNICFMRAPSNRTLAADTKRVFESVSVAPCDLFFVV